MAFTANSLTLAWLIRSFSMRDGGGSGACCCDDGDARNLTHKLSSASSTSLTVLCCCVRRLLLVSSMLCRRFDVFFFDDTDCRPDASGSAAPLIDKRRERSPHELPSLYGDENCAAAS